MMKKLAVGIGVAVLIATVVYAEPKQIRIELLAVEIQEEYSRVDAEKLLQSLDSLVREKKAAIAAKPKLTATEGEKACLNVGEDVPYMEKVGEDTFKMKWLTGKEGAGLYFEATPTITKDGKIDTAYSFSMRKLIERMPIKEAKGFQIGLPIMDCRETSSRITLENGRPQVVSGGTASKGKVFLVILTAKVIP